MPPTFKPRLTLLDLLKGNPNHLCNENLDDFIQYFWSALDMFVRIPDDMVLALCRGAIPTERNKANVIHKRMKERCAKLGLANLQQLVSMPKMRETGLGFECFGNGLKRYPLTPRNPNYQGVQLANLLKAVPVVVENRSFEYRKEAPSKRSRRPSPDSELGTNDAPATYVQRSEASVGGQLQQPQSQIEWPGASGHEDGEAMPLDPRLFRTTNHTQATQAANDTVVYGDELPQHTFTRGLRLYQPIFSQAQSLSNIDPSLQAWDRSTEPQSLLSRTTNMQNIQGGKRRCDVEEERSDTHPTKRAKLD